MFKYALEGVMTASTQGDNSAWVGFDLDGTLANYGKWEGWDHVGEPIPATIAIVKNLLSKGVKCKILTARASKVSLARNNLEFYQMEKVIQDWTEKHIGTRLPVVTEKDCYLVAFYDDKAVQVEMNTGRVLGEDITMNELAKANYQTGDAPIEVDPSTIANQTDWNKETIQPEQIDLFNAGLVEGGFKSANLPENWSGAQYLTIATADNTIIRVAINTVNGERETAAELYLMLDVYVASGSNRLAFVLNSKTDFKQIGKLIAERTMSKVSVKL